MESKPKFPCQSRCAADALPIGSRTNKNRGLVQAHLTRDSVLIILTPTNKKGSVGVGVSGTGFLYRILEQ